MSTWAIVDYNLQHLQPYEIPRIEVARKHIPNHLLEMAQRLLRYDRPQDSQKLLPKHELDDMSEVLFVFLTTSD